MNSRVLEGIFFILVGIGGAIEHYYVEGGQLITAYGLGLLIGIGISRAFLGK